MMHTKKRHDGELSVDHSCGPGLTEEMAVMMGYAPQAAHCRSFRAPTLGCIHCGGAQVMNPWRTRERGECPKCDAYICDWCAIAMREPDYEHYTIDQITEKLKSGRWELVGTMHKPKFIPKPSLIL